MVSHADTEPDHPKPAVRVHAAARVSDPIGGWLRRADYPRMASADAAGELWSRAELGPRDLDFAELYDGFSFLTLVWLEALGICGEGESGAYVEGGATARPRRGASVEHIRRAALRRATSTGTGCCTKRARSCAGEAGPRQVPNHEVAVISTGGGPFATCMVLTS